MLTQNDTIGRDYVLVDLIDLRNKGQTSTMAFADFKEARAVLRRNFLCNALRSHNGVIAQVVEVIGMLGKKLLSNQRRGMLTMTTTTTTGSVIDYIETRGPSVFFIFSYCSRK